MASSIVDLRPGTSGHNLVVKVGEGACGRMLPRFGGQHACMRACVRVCRECRPRCGGRGMHRHASSACIHACMQARARLHCAHAPARVHRRACRPHGAHTYAHAVHAPARMQEVRGRTFACTLTAARVQRWHEGCEWEAGGGGVVAANVGGGLACLLAPHAYGGVPARSQLRGCKSASDTSAPPHRS